MTSQSSANTGKVKIVERKVKKKLAHIKVYFNFAPYFKHTHTMNKATHTPKFMQSNDKVKMDFINFVVKQAKAYAKKNYTFEKMLVLIAHKGSSVEYVLGKAWASKVVKFTIAK
jgi:hypothetical protein